MGNTLSKFAKGEPGQAALNAQLTERRARQAADPAADAASQRAAGRLVAQPSTGGLQRAPARTKAASTLPHWGSLPPGRAREYTGQVYDPSIVKRVFPQEIYSWEHHLTTPALVDLAQHDTWEDHAVPPIELAYCEAGVDAGGRRLHYAIADGHHRLNAARQASAGIPAMVTHSWAPDAQGQHIDRNGVPCIAGDLPGPRAWNRAGKAQAIRVPEKIEQTSVWGTQQLTVSLPGSKQTSSLADIAEKLNAFKRPTEFLDRTAGDMVRVRLTLQDVFGREDANSKHGDMKADLQFANVDHAATDWKAILKDARPLKAHFPSSMASKYPILLVQVQQSRYSFITDAM